MDCESIAREFDSLRPHMDEKEICQEIEEQCRLIRENNGVKPEWMQRLAEMEARRWRNTLNRLEEQ